VATASTSDRLRRLVPEPTSRPQAVLAVAAATLIVLAIAVGTHSRGDTASPVLPTAPSTAAAKPAPSAAKPVAVSAARLSELASFSGRPIYWVGPRPGRTYELTRSVDGSTALRYLPAGVPVGDKREFLTIGTYPVSDAYAVTKAVTGEQGAVSKALPNGAIAVYRPASPTSVYVASPGVEVQIEVFSPSPALARELATSGLLKPVPGSAPTPKLTPGAPRAVSVADLKALSLLLDQPIYWAGPRAGVTYELTQKGTELFLRYLPQGMPVGSEKLARTIGTYAVANAFGVTAEAATQPDARQVEVGVGAVGFYRPSAPESVYFAVRGQDLQIEVYDPDAAKALELATSGRVRPVG
jgi:hypothetical protein